MIADSAGPPEVRCIICGEPAGFNYNESHPNFKHRLYTFLAVLEYQFGVVMARLRGWY